MKRTFRRLRESINILVYDTQHQVLRSLRILTFLAAIFSTGICIYYYGYPHTPERAELLITLIKSAFTVFILNYVINFFFTLEKIAFLKRSWFEGLLILLLIYDGISMYLFNVPLLQNTFQKMGIINFTPFYVFFVQLYMMILAWLGISRISKGFWNMQINPVFIFIVYYCVIIFAGAMLLYMPEMTVQEGSLRFTEALFTAASASTLTGLQVVETHSFFSFKGHIVILLLIQAGGIGILCFATFFAIFLRRGIGIKQHTILQDLTGGHSLIHTARLVREVVIYIVVIELVGAAILFILWPNEMPFVSRGERIFYSIFHAISAFSNTGFNLMEGGLQHPATKHFSVLHLTFAGLMMLGAIGFPAVRDLFGLRNLRDRMRKPWKQWKTSTSISVLGTTIVVALGGILLYFAERPTALADMSVFEAGTTSFFQAVSRTSGYQTIDFSQLSSSSYVLLILLMFIGGASGSFAGGIKISTFFILSLVFIANVRGKETSEFKRRAVPFDLQNRAFSIFTFSVLSIMTIAFLLSMTDPEFSTIQIVFESVSAFSISGWTTGITQCLSTPGQMILALAMFLGRVGTLVLAFALGSPKEVADYNYPKHPLMVG